MIRSLHKMLDELGLEYHKLEAVQNGTIVLIAKSLAAEGIAEVMRIKELADRCELTAKWDGRNIEIRR